MVQNEMDAYLKGNGSSIKKVGIAMTSATHFSNLVAARFDYLERFFEVFTCLYALHLLMKPSTILKKYPP